MAPGSRWRSAECTTEVVVVRAPSEEGSLACGDAAMTSSDGSEPPSCAAGAEPDVLLGKRYDATDVGLEVLCIKAGCGPLSFGGVRLALKEAKALPSSD